MDLMGELDEEYVEVQGDDVLGDDVLGMSLVGSELDDDDIEGAGPRRRVVRRRRRRGRPRWRHQLAPGVPTPGYGVYPIPLTPLTNNGIFTAAFANIEYRAVAQIPFRGERLLAGIRRSAGVAQASLVLATNGVHIGIRPQIGVLGDMNLDDFVPGAFGVRMVMQPATQGAEIRVFAHVAPVLTGTGTIALSLQILGRIAT